MFAAAIWYSRRSRNKGDNEVALTLRMVGGRLGARGRVVGWPGEKEKGFRALYSVEGPTMTLRSAQVKVPFGWAKRTA